MNVEEYAKGDFNSVKPSGFLHTDRFIIPKLDVMGGKWSALVRVCGRKSYYSGCEGVRTALSKLCFFA